MGFDIQYLLLLQELRNATGGCFDEILNAISKFAVDILIFLPYVVFWCVDRAWGYRFMSTLWTGEVVNGVIKLSVCAYRPWIRSDLIEPAGDSKVAATGYSFPSGHTMVGTAIYGTAFVWQKDKRKWLAGICAVMIILTGFSRNFLGVHTPQDVVVGFAVSCLLIYVVGMIGKKTEGNDKLIDKISIAGIVFIILALVYIQLKPYPMDYVDGVLLVDPQKMMNDTFKACGGLLGLIVGSFIERHYLHYEIPRGSKNLAALTAIGISLMIGWNFWMGNATFVALFGSHWGNMLQRFLMIMFALTLWPMVIKKYCSENEETGNVARTIAVTVAVIAFILIGLYVTTSMNAKSGASEEASGGKAGALSLWEDGARAKEELINFVEAATKEGGPDYIPVENRIAVFDLDGTLFSETNPIYFDHALLVHRVMEDPAYAGKASEKELETTAKILQWVQDGEYPKNMDTEHGQAIASSFAGMTVDEFEDYVEEFGRESAPGYDGMTRSESFYKPMLEVLEYLKDNGFTSYIVSGTDRLIVRGAVRNSLDLPMSQIIGSDEVISASNQGDEDGLSYVFEDSDKLILKGDFVVKNLKMNKVSAIAREIGVQPVLSFGNSTGDSSMAKYTTTDNKYKSLAFMLCCDDTEREYGNEEKAAKMFDLCAEEGWIPISMKNDWSTIYGEGVTKNPEAGLDIYDKEYEEMTDYLPEAEEDKAA